MIRTTDWVMDPDNKEDVIKVLLPEHKNDRTRAEEDYEETTSRQFGFTPRSRIDTEGIRTIIQLRETAGLMKAPLPKPEKYIEEQFYQKALVTLKNLSAEHGLRSLLKRGTILSVAKTTWRFMKHIRVTISLAEWFTDGGNRTPSDAISELRGLVDSARIL